MKIRIALLISLFGLLVTGSVFAAGYAWRDHAAPYNFLFGNHIDTHQQSKVLRNGQLNGFLYIVYTGEEMDGVPAAMHGDCTMQPEACAVGWMLQGVPVQATLLDKPEGDHPQWCINKQDMPRQRGYSHFHWLGAPEHAGDLQIGEVYDGYLLKLTARATFFFEHHGGFLVTPGIDTETHANVVTNCEG
ncbi:MAG: hypothetical protein H6654_04880 [Ardenticatenaceae bacterium]|nr:hypothetical protein [Anaerolineales bacterium]MCB8941761.1 hypothetical protein [Ardenticatenaceae bacterium]MCB8972872.1 hypothetical protein [Ardenticatenaceae bacterium]